MDTRLQVDLQKHPECQHLGIVFLVARRFERAFGDRIPGLDFDDLIQTGWMVLQRCYKLYDPSKGIQFATYLGRSIWRAFRVAALATRPIKVPVTSLTCAMQPGNPGRDHLVTARRRATLRQALKAMKLQRAAPVVLQTLCSCSYVDDAWIDIDALQVALGRIPWIERTALNLHYGIDIGEPLTLQAIGDQERLGKKYTRERVRQIVKRGIDRLHEILSQ